MNIKSEDLPRYLKDAENKGNLEPLWIIVGEEPLLAQEAGDAIRSTATAMGYTERNVLALSANSDWSALIDSLTSVSLFDDKKIIELRFLSSGPGVKGSKTLAQFAQMVPEIDSTVTIVHLTQGDYSTQKASWFKALAAVGNVIACQPVARNLYPRWISNRLRRQQQSMSMEALNFFAEQTEGNLLAAKQELMKLSLLYPAKELTLEEVENSVMNVSRYSLEDLIEAIAFGDVARVSRTVNGMQAEDEPLPLILMRLSSLIRDALAVAENRQAPVMPSMRMAVSKLTARCSAKKLANALDRCADLDRLAKGLTLKNRNDVWSELKTLCVFLAHSAHRN
ncbi:MAG TPA: DNA polymerase III subunit delta [Candidatus Aphodousia gallistercoris]|nr:DNA polymerase III subunit delta [Candidatus Aphodousia gallistercoris]